MSSDVLWILTGIVGLAVFAYGYFLSLPSNNKEDPPKMAFDSMPKGLRDKTKQAHEN